MPTTGVKGYKWGNATQGVQGQIVYKTAVDTVDFTTAVTQFPHGVLLNAPKQNETAQVNIPQDGDIVLLLANGTTDIASGDRLKTNSTGRGIKAGAKSGTYVATEVWIVGVSEEDFTANQDGLIAAKWKVLEGNWT